MAVSPIAVALQGLGYEAMLIALQGLVSLLQAAIAADAGGGSARRTRRKVLRVSPALPMLDEDEDAVLALLGII